MFLEGEVRGAVTKRNDRGGVDKQKKKQEECAKEEGGRGARKKSVCVRVCVRAQKKGDNATTHHDKNQRVSSTAEVLGGKHDAPRKAREKDKEEMMTSAPCRTAGRNTTPKHPPVPQPQHCAWWRVSIVCLVGF